MVLERSATSTRVDATYDEGHAQAIDLEDGKVQAAPPALLQRDLSRSSSKGAKQANGAEGDLLKTGRTSDMAQIERLHAQLMARLKAASDIGQLQPDEVRENEHLRTFRLRLCKAEEELARKGDAPPVDWRQEALNVAEELEHTHTLVCQLEHQMKILQERLQNARSQADEREEEHRVLLCQVAAYEKENAALRQGGASKLTMSPTRAWRDATAPAQLDNSSLAPSTSRPQTAALSVSERRQLEDAIRRYKKLLDAEAQKTREARAAHLAVEAEFQRYRRTTAVPDCVENRESTIQQQRFET